MGPCRGWFDTSESVVYITQGSSAAAIICSLDHGDLERLTESLLGPHLPLGETLLLHHGWDVVGRVVEHPPSVIFEPGLLSIVGLGDSLAEHLR